MTKIKYNAFTNALTSLPTLAKQVIAILVDVSFCTLATYGAFYLRLGEFIFPDKAIAVAISLSVSVAIPIFAVLGMYRMVFRYSGWPASLLVGTSTAIYALVYLCLILIVGLEGIPRTIGIIQPVILFFGISGWRMLVYWGYRKASKKNIRSVRIDRVLIFGAGAAGRRLVSVLGAEERVNVVGFIDDDLELQGRVVVGKRVWSRGDLGSLIGDKGITHIFLAVPSVSRSKRLSILNEITQYRVGIRTLPNFHIFGSNDLTASDLQELDIDDLLGRDVIPPESELLAEKISGKTVLITGAGGSIGSELCRQILDLKPDTLLLMELNEYALYAIASELEAKASAWAEERAVKIVALLGSVRDRRRVMSIISAWNPETIYHTAAYKHVPLVEQNIVEGIDNNIFGTLVMVEVATQLNVSDFVLVSTDKAVRPTNVMGATKRIAEMILQGCQARKASNTRFSIVRFGNVVGSSGSVIPKFRDQILSGGPITVTHPEVTRFFMTIPEAAQLVIQASSLSRGGDVFVLDMGEPIKIIDLARKMIRLSGLTERVTGGGTGDIEIKIVGLRHNEKLYEELLIGNNQERTAHPKILRAKEVFIEWDQLRVYLSDLKDTLVDNDVKSAIKILRGLVDGFVPESKLIDNLAIHSHELH